jgi:hypothetical protein
MPLGFNFRLSHDKKTMQYAILIVLEIITLAMLWWKFFWGSGLMLIWFAGTLFVSLSLVYVNNFLVGWFNAPKKKKPKDTLAERKKNHVGYGR